MKLFCSKKILCILMNAIIGMTTLAEKNLQNPERLQDYLVKIRLSSEHLLQLINEILDMSK